MVRGYMAKEVWTDLPNEKPELEVDDTELTDIIAEISEYESKASILREKYSQELSHKGLEKLADKKLSNLWSKDIDYLKQLIVNYFKFIRQYPAPTLLDSQQRFNMFYLIILFLNKYLIFMPLEPKIPKTLPYYMGRFKKELTFFSQLYSSFIAPLPVAYGVNKYKILIPAWRHGLSDIDILDYCNDLEFYEILIKSINILNELIEVILTDLSDIQDIGELLITAQTKKETYKASLDEE